MLSQAAHGDVRSKVQLVPASAVDGYQISGPDGLIGSQFQFQDLVRYNENNERLQ